MPLVKSVCISLYRHFSRSFLYLHEILEKFDDQMILQELG